METTRLDKLEHENLTLRAKLIKKEEEIKTLKEVVEVRDRYIEIIESEIKEIKLHGTII